MCACQHWKHSLFSHNKCLCSLYTLHYAGHHLYILQRVARYPAISPVIMLTWSNFMLLPFCSYVQFLCLDLYHSKDLLYPKSFRVFACFRSTECIFVCRGLVLVIDTIQSNPFTQKYNLSCSFHVILQCVRVCL